MFNMRKLFGLLAFMLPLLASAQWHVGVSGGATCNHFAIDRNYQADVQFHDRWGGTVGVMGQYDVTEWLGVRAELLWMQKNYRQQRKMLSEVDYKWRNNYLVLPVMASFSFGGERLRGFCNAGVYGGYWMNQSRSGSDYNYFTNKTYHFSEQVSFNSERDRRWDFGFVAGLGARYGLGGPWAVQAELRYYHSTVSTQKDYMLVKDSRYHSTLALMAGVWYSF